VLSGLLGRLNGKSDGQLEKEEHARRDVKLMTYVGQDERRMGFVSGGFLIGDKIEASSEALKESSEASSTSEKLSKKRKRSEFVANSSEKQKKKAHAEKVEDDLDSNVVAEEEPTREQKKERRARKEARKLRREEKRARKGARQAKRETKREPRLKEESSDSADSDDGQSPNNQPDSESSRSGDVMPPAPSPIARGRNVVRQRYIQQKRMACMDERALKEVSERLSMENLNKAHFNQIFMIKSKT
jgi:Pin2-interacting protein X1